MTTPIPPTPPTMPNVAAAPLGALPFAGLLEALAAKTPAPGGGAAACAAGGLAAALAGMVVAYSLGKKDLAEHQPVLAAAAQELTRARELLLGLADEDAGAYAWLNGLRKLPEADARRAADLPAAAAACVQIPLAALAAGVDLLRLMQSLATRTNRHLRSDLAIAAVLAEAAARASAWNVRVNLAGLGDDGARAALAAQVEDLVGKARELAAAVEAACAR